MSAQTSPRLTHLNPAPLNPQDTCIAQTYHNLHEVHSQGFLKRAATLDLTGRGLADICVWPVPDCRRPTTIEAMSTKAGFESY